MKLFNIDIPKKATLKDYRNIGNIIFKKYMDIGVDIECNPLIKDFLNEKHITLEMLLDLEIIFDDWKKGKYKSGFIIH